MTKRPSVMSLDDLMGAKAETLPPSTPGPGAVPQPEPVPPVPVDLVLDEAPQPPGRKPVPDVFRTSLYFHRTVHDALREIAYEERLTISDLINEGIDHVLKGRAYPSAADLKTKGARKRKR